jgi:hypothetical protein
MADMLGANMENGKIGHGGRREVTAVENKLLIFEWMSSNSVQVADVHLACVQMAVKVQVADVPMVTLKWLMSNNILLNWLLFKRLLMLK